MDSLIDDPLYKNSSHKTLYLWLPLLKIHFTVNQSGRRGSIVLQYVSPNKFPFLPPPVIRKRITANWIKIVFSACTEARDRYSKFSINDQTFGKKKVNLFLLDDNGMYPGRKCYIYYRNA